jgi:hypothetical protein
VPGDGDQVSGTGTITRGNTFTFDAWANADGSDPQGFVRFEAASDTIEGQVICLQAASGPRATLVYVDTDPPSKAAGTVGGIVRLHDDPAGDRQRNGRINARQLARYRAECPGADESLLNEVLSGGFTVFDDPGV